MRYLLPIMLCFAGCFSRPSAPPIAGAVGAGGAYPALAGPTILATVTLWAAGLAALAIFAGIVLFALGRRRLGGDIAIAGVAVSVCVPIVLWLDRNLWWIAAAVALVGLAVAGMWAWHRLVPMLEKAIGIDLNRDGKVGAA